VVEGTWDTPECDSGLVITILHQVVLLFLLSLPTRKMYKVVMVNSTLNINN
jgi:hypothetical protein